MEYDGQKDLTESIKLGLAIIRERMAAGGPGWKLKDESAPVELDATPGTAYLASRVARHRHG